MQLSAQPCIASSFGKDSMVLLYLIRQQYPNIPVVFFRHFEHPTKHSFADRIIQDWNLRVVSPSAKYRECYGQPGNVEILDIYELNDNRFLTTPIAQEDRPRTAQSMCGLSLLNYGPENACLKFDTVFLGQRYSDADLIAGSSIIQRPVIEQNGFRYVYPLFAWSDEDIWQAIRDFDIPYNIARYDQNDDTANGDVWDICTNCLSTTEPVMCPVHEIYVPGMSDLVDISSRTTSMLTWHENWKEDS